MNKREFIKQMYIEDKKSIDDICIAVDIKRATFYYHKRRDKEKGVDWDELRVANQQSIEDLKERETLFISKLIDSFEVQIDRLNEELPEKSIEIIAKYINTYYKIKHPINKDCKSEKIAGANEAIKIIADIAIAKDKKELVSLLSQNSEEIISRVSKIA